MIYAQFRTGYGKITENMENEKYTLKDVKYGDEN